MLILHLGCEKPRTCKESRYGCCPDGLSPAQGNNNEGCPVEPCADTLFGCCASDNKTAAQGNDQDGCPPPPPACTTSKYGFGKLLVKLITNIQKNSPLVCTELALWLKLVVRKRTRQCVGRPLFHTGCSISIPNSQESLVCFIYRYGCCADNETEATGPEKAGCPETGEFSAKDTNKSNK